MPKIQSFDELLDRARAAQQAIRDINLSLIEAHDADELKKLDRAIDVLDTLNRDGADSATAAPPETALDKRHEAPAAVFDPIMHEQIMSSTPTAAPAGPPAAAPAAAPAVTGPVTAPEHVERTRPKAPERPLPTAAKAPPAASPVRSTHAAAARPTLAEKPIVTPNTAPTSFAEQISKGIYTRRLRRVFVTGRGQGMVQISEMPHRDGLPPFDNCLAPDDSPVDGAYGVFVHSQAVFAAVLKRPFDSHRWQVIESIPCAQQKDIVDAVAHMLRRPTVDIQVD